MSRLRLRNMDLWEGTDKANFLRWLVSESIVSLDANDINRICDRWIRLKIRQEAEMAREIQKRRDDARP